MIQYGSYRSTQIAHIVSFYGALQGKVQRKKKVSKDWSTWKFTVEKNLQNITTSRFKPFHIHFSINIIRKFYEHCMYSVDMVQRKLMILEIISIFIIIL